VSDAAASPADSTSTAMPAGPYRGIEEFRFVDAPIFFGRDDEARALLRLVTMYRGVLLYGDSGAGKSSLINAKLMPLAVGAAFAPERIRVQPELGAEFIIERVATTDGPAPLLLPTIFGTDPAERRITLSAEAFRQTLEGRCAARVVEGRLVVPAVYPLLIFDQFEELTTLTEEALRDARGESWAWKITAARQAITDALVALLQHETLSVKILFAFREDYYAKLSTFFARHPHLTDQCLRLEPLHIDELPLIINGPFAAQGVTFDHELQPAVRISLEAELRVRARSDLLNLTEVQIAGLKLWNTEKPAELLASLHVDGLLENYFTEAIDSIPSSLRDAAVILLDLMVTSLATRNVVSSETLLAGAQEEKIARDVAEQALQHLDQEAHVIRREVRNEVVIYEIVSEYLVPWIMRNKAAAGALERERRWMRGFWVAVAIGLIAVLGAFVYSYRQSSEHLRTALTKSESELAEARNSFEQTTALADARLATVRTQQDQLSKFQHDVAEQKAYISRLEASCEGHN
jgi:hypothetical protein